MSWEPSNTGIGCSAPLLVAAALVIGTAQTSAAQPSSGAAEDASVFARRVAPFLEQHCHTCHGPEKQESGLRFDGPRPDLTDPDVYEQWAAAKRMIAEGEMPPEERPRPSADEIITVLDWIAAATSRAAAETRGGLGRRALRRLTPREYVSTLHDLLGLHFPHATYDLNRRLPADRVDNHFSNNSDLQVTQEFFVRRGLEVAEDMLAVALPDAGKIRPLRYEVDLRAVVADALEQFQARPEEERQRTGGPAIKQVEVPAGGGDLDAARLSLQGDRGDKNAIVPVESLDPDRGLLLEPNAITAGVNKNAVSLLLPFVPDRGVLRLKVRAGAELEHYGSVPTLRLSFGGPNAPGNVAYPAAEARVTAPADAPEEYVLEVPLLLAEADWDSYRRERQLFIQIDNAAALLAPTPKPPDFNSKQREKYLNRNRLLLESLVLEVQRSPTWPPASEAVLRTPKEGEGEEERARRTLGAFMAKAFRRPPTATELEQFHGLYRAKRKAGESFVEACRIALTAVLISPQVLYLLEPKGEQREPLSAWETAARLSYLLWNRPPDEELRARAADGSLLTDEELLRQFRRLLADERAFAFAGAFTRQWLELDRLPHLDRTFGQLVRSLGSAIDSREDLEWYDKILLRDLAAEPAHYLLHMLRRDRPVSELVSAEQIVVNDRLAEYYGVTGVQGPDWRPVPAPPDRRGGLLSQAGVIRAATVAQERGEIIRGVYLLERFLGIDVPTPPGNANIRPLDVQATEDETLRNLTPREHMERHRRIQTCAACHQRIDPLGFVWDAFDPYGQRKRDRQGEPLPFDSSGRLPDKTPFSDFGEFRRLLAEGSPAEGRLATAFSRRLYEYVLGRRLDFTDDRHLETIRGATTGEGDGLRALLAAMVLSEPFRYK